MGKKTSEKPVQYVLTLSEEQAECLSAACEFYARIRIGQFNEIIHRCLDLSIETGDYCRRRDEAERLLYLARKEIYPELYGIGHSYGVGNCTGKMEDAGIVWELYEVLRNKIAWHEHPEGGGGVNFYPPWSIHGRPLAKCEVVEIK